MEIVRIFQKYLYPLTNVLKCVEGDDLELDDLNTSFLDSHQDNFISCFNDFGFDNPKCQEICKTRDIFSYKILANFYKVSKQMLAIWFPKLTEKEIKDYYESVMQLEWTIEEIGTINFFPTMEESLSPINISSIE